MRYGIGTYTTFVNYDYQQMRQKTQKRYSENGASRERKGGRRERGVRKEVYQICILRTGIFAG